MAVHVVRNDGLLALYNGLSASLCRQVGSAQGGGATRGFSPRPTGREQSHAARWRRCSHLEGLEL